MEFANLKPKAKYIKTLRVLYCLVSFIRETMIQTPPSALDVTIVLLLIKKREKK